MPPFIILITFLIQFQSVGLLQESSDPPALVQENISICQHCQRVGHMKYQCFDLHPCEHCGQHNHPSDRCFKHKRTARVKNHYGWIPCWRWPSIAKKICQSYWRIHSRVLTHFVVNIFSNYKKPARIKKPYGWISSWLWSSIFKKICQSYWRIHSSIDKYCSGDIFIFSPCPW